MCFARTGPTKSGTGCCGSPNDSVINGLAGWYGASSSVVRIKGERSACPAGALPAPCATPEEAVIAMSETPALSIAVEGHTRGPQTHQTTIDTARLRRV